MTSGVWNNPTMCKICGKKQAIRKYCEDCQRLAKIKKNKKYKHTHGFGMLIIPGVKRAPKITIIYDPLEIGSFPCGTTFTGQTEIKYMLSTHAFTDNTIIEAGGHRLRIVGSKFEAMEDEK
jgi:hypothetical protein